MKLPKLYSESALTFLLFLGLFVYLILRAVFVAPMHDEAATYYHYIETGLIMDKMMVVDANNHLMNSYIARFFYLLGCDDYFYFRISNVLSFILYFIGIRRLLRPIADWRQRFILLMACCSAPFVLEYFAYTRGYGLGMAFFVWVMYFAYKYVEKPSVKYAFLLQGSLFLALFACLIFMGSLCLVMLLLVWAYWKHRKLFSAKDHLRWWLVFIFYILLFTPLIAYTLFLKNTGALYYGSLDGMWKVTGKTLSQNVFFQDGIWLKWLLFGIIMIGIIRYLIRLKGINIFKFLQNQEHILAYFFFGNLCIIWLLAKLLHVNYPEDRTGMYLILLAILLFGFSLQDRKWSRWIALLLCYFPVSLIAHMSLTTCVFAPETRIGNDFYRIVKKQLASNNNIIVYPTMHLCWHYHERMQNQKNFPNASREFNPVFDFILTRDVMVLKRPDPTLFKLIAVDKESGHLAYKRIKPMHRKNWYQHTFKISKTRVERMDLKSFDISNLDSTKKIEVIVKGEVFIETPYESLIFGMGVCNDKNEELRYDYMEQRWSEGAKNSHFFVNIRYVFENFRPEEKKLQVYLLNRFKKQIRLVNGIIEVKLLEP